MSPTPQPSVHLAKFLGHLFGKRLATSLVPAKPEKNQLPIKPVLAQTIFSTYQLLRFFRVRADIFKTNYKITKLVSYENTLQIQDHFVPEEIQGCGFTLPSKLRIGS